MKNSPRVVLDTNILVSAPFVKTSLPFLLFLWFYIRGCISSWERVLSELGASATSSDITSNLKDFRLAQQTLGLQVLTPKQLLVWLAK